MNYMTIFAQFLKVAVWRIKNMASPADTRVHISEGPLDRIPNQTIYIVLSKACVLPFNSSIFNMFKC